MRYYVTVAARFTVEHSVAEDRRDCYWLYVVTNCKTMPQLQEPTCLPRRLRHRQVRDPARFEWHEVTKVAHYYLSVDALTKPMQVREELPPYGASQTRETGKCD